MIAALEAIPYGVKVAMLAILICAIGEIISRHRPPPAS